MAVCVAVSLAAAACDECVAAAAIADPREDRGALIEEKRGSLSNGSAGLKSCACRGRKRLLRLPPLMPPPSPLPHPSHLKCRRAREKELGVLLQRVFV